MESGIFDKNGIEIKEGDIIVFPYVDPKGRLTKDESFRKEVLFKYGCFGYETQIDFIPLFEWMKKKEGDYIPNKGNKNIYTKEYEFWVQNTQFKRK